MNPVATLAALARAFTVAWTSHDMDIAATYLADEVTFDGPMNHSTGKQAYMEGLNTFARTVTSAKILATFGDDRQALVMYEVAITPFGTLICAELLTFRDGKIAADVLTFDTSPMRGTHPGQSAQPPTAPAATE